MSTLAAVQADGFYYPPNWSPSKGGLNKFHHSHPLGSRARKLGQGIVIVRFEMPVNVWCEGCNEHIARGVRYNAEKKKCGTYFSSDVFEFQMNCHICGQKFIIKTDPQNRDYEFVFGLRRKIETFDAKDIGTKEFDEKEQLLMRADAIRSLENKETDKLNSEKLAPTLDRLKDLKDRIYKNEHELNREVRGIIRQNRKAEEHRQEKAEHAGLGIKLLPTSKSDIRKSAIVDYRTKSKAQVNADMKKLQATSGNIFGSQDKSKERALKKCLTSGMDLRLLKVGKDEKKESSMPGIVIKAKPKDPKDSKNSKNSKNFHTQSPADNSKTTSNSLSANKICLVPYEDSD